MSFVVMDEPPPGPATCERDTRLISSWACCRGRAWAHRWSRAWAIGALASVAAMILLSLAIIGPALNAVTSPPPVVTMWEAPLFELMLWPHRLAPEWRAIVLAGFYAPYPLVVLSRTRLPV
jgi:hypothetical protein